MPFRKALSPTAILLALLLLGIWNAASGQELPTFQVVARDGHLFPERLEVPSGTKIKLALRNDSRSPVEFENLDLRVEKVLAPGAGSFVVIHSLQPGSYKFVDEFHATTAQLLLIAK